MSRVPTVTSLLPDPLVGGPEDTISMDSWDDVDENDDSKKSLYHRLQFFLTCLGYSVGLGNIWRFPYMIYRNGGAFLLPFTVMVVFIGMPLYYLEIVIAQFTSRGPVGIWEVAPLFKGIGYAMTIISALVAMYYNVIISWTLLYFIKSLHSELPWNECTTTEYSPSCIHDVIHGGIAEKALLTPSTTESLDNLTNVASFINTEMANMSLVLMSPLPENTSLGTTTPVVSSASPINRSMFFGEKFFLHSVLHLSENIEDIGEPQWQLSLSLLLVSCFVATCLARNIRSFGKVSSIMSVSVIVFLSVFLVKVISHGGQSYVHGVKFFISIDWSRMKSSQVWIDAAYEVIFSLGPCFGGLVALASKNDFHHNCYKDALLVVIFNSVLSVFGGFVVYALLGHFCGYINKSPEDSVSVGMGLSFIIYPMALSELPVAQLWSALFFFILFLIGLESNVGIMATAVEAVSETVPHHLLKRRPLASLLVVLVVASGGILLTTQSGLPFIVLLDTYALGDACLIIGFFECIVVVYIYGIERLSADMKAMFKEAPSPYWKIMWKFITPGLIIALLLFTWLDYEKVEFRGEQMPEWVELLRWSISGCVLLTILSCMIYSIVSRLMYRESIRGLCHPEMDWGPSKPENRKKLQSALYNTSLEPVMMVRVAVDADDISPTGMVIGAKPDSVIPYGFFLNQNQKSKRKHKNRIIWQPSPHDVATPTLPRNYWPSELNKFASIASSHASSGKSARGSLSNFNQATQTDEAQNKRVADDCIEENHHKTLNMHKPSIYEAVNPSMNVPCSSKNVASTSKDEESDTDNQRAHKHETDSNIYQKKSSKDKSRNSESKAIFFLESSEHAHYEDHIEEVQLRRPRGRKATKKTKNLSYVITGHDNSGYASA